MNILKSCYMKILNIALLMYVLSLLIPVSAAAVEYLPSSPSPYPPPDGNRSPGGSL